MLAELLKKAGLVSFGISGQTEMIKIPFEFAIHRQTARELFASAVSVVFGA